MSGGYVNSPRGWEPTTPVESAEGCVYPNWKRTSPVSNTLEDTMAKAKMSAKAAQAKLAEMGVTIDWEKWKTFNYVQFFNAAKQIYDLLYNLFRSEVTMRATAPDAEECCLGCKEHFELVKTVADCGIECCEQATA